MKKIIHLLGVMAMINMQTIAQTTLPTDWSFPTTIFPNGWSTNEVTPSYYTASGFNPPAYKFDATGDIVTVYFADAPGVVTYYLAGNSFADGEFRVEESVDGVSWSTLHSFTGSISTTYTQFSDIADAESRYIRFNYINKVTGNIGLDEVVINPAAATADQEISIEFDLQVLVNGGTSIVNSPVGVETTYFLLVKNLGTGDVLNISSASFSGIDAADFNIIVYPNTVNAGSEENISFSFTPASAGTKIAALTIGNDDADESSFVINFNGIGGELATEPSAQATNLTFGNVKTFNMNASFSPASPAAEGYLILKKKGNSILDEPTDGVVYERGDYIGSSIVVASSVENSFYPTDIVANTQYAYKVFAYNGPNEFRNYNLVNALEGNTTTPETMQPAGYYDAISTSSSTFVSDLHDLINPHSIQFYSNYGIKMVALYEARDTTDNQRVLTCVYSGENKVYTEPFDFTANSYSREHTYCQSWMPTDGFDDLPEYNDYHHLFPTNQPNANGIRSNYPLGEVVNIVSTYLDGKFGNDANGLLVYEPRDAQKGAAARAMMYESLCYNTVSGNNWQFPSNISTSVPYGQDQNIIKYWHFQYPPDNFEIGRNDLIDSLQGNRNPFIDIIDYACYIDFNNNLNYVETPSNPCYAVGLAQSNSNKQNLLIVPNPNNGNFKIIAYESKMQNSIISIYDMRGKIIYTSQVKSQNILNFNFSELGNGIYSITLSDGESIKTARLLIE
jgi:hypothetical protein